MATINYNGMELEEFTTPQIFDPPKTMVVWEDDEKPTTAVVIALLAKSSNFQYRVVINDCSFYPHCALLPDPPKPRRATNRELARWMAQGNGEYKEIITDHECCMTYFYYSDRGRNVELPKGIKVRKWSDTEWHEPTVDYLFGGDNDSMR
jgi:hypothetical protein